ncbi:MAG: flagellar export chaperone FliS [Peptococcaceae bacterium]
MALAQNPYAQYKQQSIATAGPEKLLIMLFDGAIRFLGQAKSALEAKDIEKTNYYLIRCQNIVYELMGSLNMEYEISQSLFQMYEYINYNLQQANMQKDVKFLAEPEQYLREFRETWVQAARLVKTPSPGTAGGD